MKIVGVNLQILGSRLLIAIQMRGYFAKLADGQLIVHSSAAARRSAPHGRLHLVPLLPPSGLAAPPAFRTPRGRRPVLVRTENAARGTYGGGGGRRQLSPAVPRFQTRSSPTRSLASSLGHARAARGAIQRLDCRFLDSGV
jgi:hypothetical protein